MARELSIVSGMPRLVFVGVTLQVRFVRGPGVIEWVINVCNRRRERELAHHPLEILGGLD